MYIGINQESGKKVRDEDAFIYAIERCTTDFAEKFIEEFKGYPINTVEDMRSFRFDLMEWFYSGNWIYKEG